LKRDEAGVDGIQRSAEGFMAGAPQVSSCNWQLGRHKQENHKELHWEEFHNDPANGNFDTNA